MKRSLFALGLLTALPFAAAQAADGISYNFVEGGYAATSTDATATPVPSAQRWRTMYLRTR